MNDAFTLEEIMKAFGCMFIATMLSAVTASASTLRFSCGASQRAISFNGYFDVLPEVGQEKGTGNIAEDGFLLANLNCTYTSGATVSLHCDGDGYEVDGYGDLNKVDLLRNGKLVTTLSCQ